MFPKYCTPISILVLVFSLGLIPLAAETARSDRHIVVVVWDGMRPDFVNEETTPTLWKLAREGITFRNHHPVYPSATQVNGTALVTGVYPGRSGVIANYVYRPEIDRTRSISVESPTVVARGDELSGGKYISVPTITELVQRAGGRTAIASAKTVGLLLDRHAGIGPAKNCVTLFAGQALPRDILTPIVAALGPFPSTHLQHDAWTTKAVTDFLWKDGVPALSVIWLGEPDLTEHESAPGAPSALAAIKSSDENLAAILSALDMPGSAKATARQASARATTDIFVVSDHGFSTIKRSIDLRKILSDAGFAAKTEFDGEPKPGDIMLVGNGGSVLFYVVGHDATLVHRLVEFLQQSDFAGVIFTKQGLPGTFHLDDAKIDNPHAPDVVMAFRWNDSKNQFGTPGMIDADWQREAGKGTHATLSRFDMHNTLIAAGPDFRRGQTDDLPTGNVDLAPTILHILGIKPPQEVDGRVLSEAMVGVDQVPIRREAETKTIEATKDLRSGSWRQTLKISQIGSTIYLDEGNGSFAPKMGGSSD
ncbi:MAG: Type I phosphodiesterase / nucleotide pyrophosphatase [Candidatus Udaeobacter sp.]|nr:MAG: Type I phosphodiesterase / nucleotide pyrophosphatase [Candidatus Udaeobacter sp.]